MANILIISPQAWDFIQVSKHHYARAAAECGHQLYFLEPPDDAVTGVTLTITEHSGIIRVRYPLPCYDKVRFHARPIYDALEACLIRKICRALPPLDLVWSFEPNRFLKLRKFAGRKVIYHPVDALGQTFHLLPAQSADQVYSVSKTILAPFLDLPVPAALLAHGVAPAFAELAESGADWVRPVDALKVGFAGNLSRPIVARSMMLALMTAHPEVEFHFWGQSEAGRDADARTREFLNSLKSQPNCRLRGIQPTDVLAAQFAEMDIFLLAYQPDPLEPDFDFSNSHKILEYLATGRVTLSSPLSEYENLSPELMVFAEDNSLESFIRRFDDILSRLADLNRPELARLRRDLALENRYSIHWAMIERSVGL